MPDLVSTQDRYQLDPTWSRLGGMSTVYRATRASDGARVVCKVANLTAAAVNQMEQERRALVYLMARNADASTWMVSLLDQGVSADGRPFLVLPALAWSLDEWATMASRSLRTKLEVAVQICSAVSRLHRCAEDPTSVTLHWDLKPANFLGDGPEEAPRFVLADLGGVRGGRLMRTVAGTTAYTFGYAPPEQMLCVAWRADPCIDVHALAATLYELLTDRLPAALAARPHLLLHEAVRALEALHAIESRTEEEEARYQALRRRDLREYMRLDEMEALSRADEHRLQACVLEGIASDIPDREGRAARIAAPLIGALHQALAPDPQRRLRDARELAARVQDALDQLPAEGPAPGIATEPVALIDEASGSTLADADLTEGNPPAQRRRRALLLLAGAAGTALLTAGILVLSAYALERPGTAQIATQPSDPPPPDGPETTAEAMVPEPPPSTPQPKQPGAQARGAAPPAPAQATRSSSKIAPTPPQTPKLQVGLRVPLDLTAEFTVTSSAADQRQQEATLEKKVILDPGEYKVQVRTKNTPPFTAWINVVQHSDGGVGITAWSSKGPRRASLVVPKGCWVQVIFDDPEPKIESRGPV